MTDEEKNTFSFEADTPKEDIDKLKSMLGASDSPPPTLEEVAQKKADKEQEIKEKPKSQPDDFRDRVYDPIKGMDVANTGNLAGLHGDIECSQVDKQKYIKAVLNDKPVILDINLAGGELKLKIRSKTTWEQTLSYEAAIADQDEKLVSDYYQAMIQMQKYGVMLQILEINGTPFQTEEYNRPKNSDWKEQRDELRQKTIDVLDSMNNAKLTLLLNGLRIFEYKLADMTAACNDENFWKPVS
jgi:hypothetical protein